MSTLYVYVPGTFSNKDTLPPSDPEKIITGQQFEDQFISIAPAIASRIQDVNGDFTGVLSGDTIDLNGPLSAEYINGGTFP